MKSVSSQYWSLRGDSPLRRCASLVVKAASCVSIIGSLSRPDDHKPSMFYSLEEQPAHGHENAGVQEDVPVHQLAVARVRVRWLALSAASAAVTSADRASHAASFSAAESVLPGGR